MANQIIFSPHNKILDGVNKLADAVQETLGPCGRNVLIYKNNNQTPIITKDGVTVARNITLDDQLENVGALLVKEVAGNSDIVGDGTTTATVLARAMYKEALRFLSHGYNPIDLKRDIDKQVEDIIERLRVHTRKVESLADLYKVAMIATNNDHELSDLISKAIDKVGLNGFISVEDSKTPKTTIEFVEGLQLERGLVSQYFFNDLVGKKTVYNNPNIVILNHAADNMKLLMPVLEYYHKNNLPLVLMAEEFEDNTLVALLANKVQAGLKLACMLTPGSGDFKLDYMEDLARATGATILQPDYAPMLSGFKPEMAGTCEKIVINLNQANLFGVNDLTDHINELKQSIEVCEKEYYKEKLKDRYARLTNSIGILKVGSATKNEHTDKKLRIEDAIKATKAALKGGILPGGGVPLLRCQPENTSLLTNVLDAPIKAILKNAGLNAEEIILNIKKETKFSYGYDARAAKYGDLIDLGIVDSADVVFTALRGAAAASSMLLTTSCVVMREEEKK